MSGKLITAPVRRLVNEAILKFNKGKLMSASYAEVVGQLAGYEFRNDAKGCGGYCDTLNSVINLAESNHEYYIPGGVKVMAKTMEYVTIFHEIAHALQAKVERFETREMQNLSERIKTEWEAESVAFLMVNNCVKKVPAQVFNAYFEASDLIFFKQWYNRTNLVDDLIVA